MARARIVLDCDPGVDDAVAILLALASPGEIEVLGITTVAGNVPLEFTTRNALRVLALAGRTDIPVLPGCARPIMRPAREGASVHGTDGLGDIGLPDSPVVPRPQHAVDFIIEQVMQAPGEIMLCPIGPMTNVALALIKEPAIAERIARIVFMGGAAFRPGNATPEAEFNIWFDPHAAQVVLSSGVPCVMFGLDVTNQALLTAPRLDALEHGGRVARAATAMMRCYGGGDPCLHDPCVIAYLIDPSLFGGVAAAVEVECASALTLGRTVAAVSERHREARAANCRVMTGVDAERLFGVLGERLGRL